MLLILMRLIQGFSLGGEFTGSMVYTTELASPLMRGIIASSTAAGTTLGFILGSLTAWIVNRTLGHDAVGRRGAGASRSSASVAVLPRSVGCSAVASTSRSKA